MDRPTSADSATIAMAGSPWLALRRTRSSFFMSHPSNLDLEDIPSRRRFTGRRYCNPCAIYCTILCLHVPLLTTQGTNRETMHADEAALISPVTLALAFLQVTTHMPATNCARMTCINT